MIHNYVGPDNDRQGSYSVGDNSLGAVLVQVMSDQAHSNATQTQCRLVWSPADALGLASGLARAGRFLAARKDGKAVGSMAIGEDGPWSISVLDDQVVLTLRDETRPRPAADEEATTGMSAKEALWMATMLTKQALGEIEAERDRLPEA